LTGSNRWQLDSKIEKVHSLSSGRGTLTNKRVAKPNLQGVSLSTLFDPFLYASSAEECRSRSTGIDTGMSGVFQQEPEQDQERIFLIRTRAGAGVIFSRVFEKFEYNIFAVYINCTTGVKQEQESINFT